MEIDLPAEIPVMTLPRTVFFPQSILPLRIFEPRYKKMLNEVLNTHRIFAVAMQDENPSTKTSEPPRGIATAGIIRACQKNEDGTSNLLLQGLCRIEIRAILRETPFRMIEIARLDSTTSAACDELSDSRAKALRLLSVKRKLGLNVPKEMTQFLQQIENPDAFIDLAAFSLCENISLKQRLLETLDVAERLRVFRSSLEKDISSARLQRRLQGELGEDDIPKN